MIHKVLSFFGSGVASGIAYVSSMFCFPFPDRQTLVGQQTSPKALVHTEAIESLFGEILETLD
jgi:hypothetical protein